MVQDGDRNSSVDNIWTATDLAEAKLEGSDTVSAKLGPALPRTDCD